MTAGADDAAWMRRALDLAERGLYTTDPNPRVGCLVVRGDRAVGEGWHRRAGEAHAEVLALRAAGSAARGATAYVTLEPCSHTGRTPPCADALIAAGIARVVCPQIDPNPRVAGAGIARLREAGVELQVGPLADEARRLNPGYFSRFERGRPHLRLKLAASLDGRTARADGRRAWITGEAARRDVQAWRARSSAVLTGAGTVRSDDPRLDVRWQYGDWVRQPLRVVLDPALSSAPDARVFAGGNALLFAAGDSLSRAAHGAVAAGGAERGGVRIEALPRAGRGLDLAAALARLAQLEINELLVECGPRLAAAWIEAELVDELIVYVAPMLLGSDAPPLAALRGAAGGPVAQRFEFAEICRIGEDVRLIMRPQEKPRSCSPES
ncbi:MAG TPA: bifunctional diaminohydroxyphosphoribosylaminopyrimidine deaminase/5-amino-6-(5-phosphoribosylamino)uracil reductase RibD [Steroidobacteraceae bacterium]|nr:bifunctional diaminohydroxyphosphoribosylaminopyrimidine deaminase/5-amino-6-(5-phosphoribosylamino)uracil reductase RibD [Steroidobacteraceae bacterium]